MASSFRKQQDNSTTLRFGEHHNVQLPGSPGCPASLGQMPWAPALISNVGDLARCLPGVQDYLRLKQKPSLYAYYKTK